MRINKYLAHLTGMSRRTADSAIADGRVHVNGLLPSSGQQVTDTDKIALDGQVLDNHVKMLTYMFNKPAGYVVSRDGQGSQTIYDILPSELHHLKPIGRLDKYSSGLLLLTNDGQLANELTHPSYEKEKVYEIRLSAPLATSNKEAIEAGVMLDDGVSKLQLKPLDGKQLWWEVRMHEGRNRQIRRTFEALDYKVVKLHRTNFGNYQLRGLKTGEVRQL